MKTTIFILIAAISTVQATKIDIQNCKGDQGIATSVSLSPCTSLPCNFVKGSTVTVQISFTAENNTATLLSKVYGIVAGVPVEFPLPNPNACKDSSIKCPIIAGQKYKYMSFFKVEDSYPAIKLVVMWKLQGEHSDEVCFTFPMSISPSRDDKEIIG